jgi:brefeldin A-resistance guanine nucleotide exchange factor 1
VLFPLILRLLKPEVFSSDREGMSEMRVQAASLLCKVYLQYLVLLSEWDGMLDLWVKIIDIMDRLINSGQGDSLVSPWHIAPEHADLETNHDKQDEAVRENLKNVVLFMASSGYLVHPKTDPSKGEIWTETWKRIDRFLPDLRQEVLPDEPEEKQLPTEDAVAEAKVPETDSA